MNQLSTTDRPERSRPWRMVLAGIGLACVGLATLGALLPGLPTTVFLLVASYCFAKSCPGLEERLLKRNRLFRPYLALVESGRPMPRHARVVAILTMWAFISTSLLAFHGRGTIGRTLAVGIILAGIAGTVAIVRFRRRAVGAERRDSDNQAQIA